ncbi:unnamed protein product [Cunninghamella blakesleeana]
MLAYPQELYFHNEKSITRKDSFPSIANPNLHKVTKKAHMVSHHHSIQQQNHHEKDKEEQVWPPEVEAAFIEALETIPKLGRRKILVNGKPCGRNELISDYIYRKTSKIRTRKQVSSHIQVLKNTRKSDPLFMRLLTDAVEMDEEFINRKQSTTTTKTPVKRQQTTKTLKQNKQSSTFISGHPIHPSSSSSTTTNNSTLSNNNNNNNNNSNNNPQSTPTPFTQLPSNVSITSDESSIHSSPSPADYVLDMIYPSFTNTTMNSFNTPYPVLDMKDSFYSTLPTSTSTIYEQQQQQQQSLSSTSFNQNHHHPPSMISPISTTTNTTNTSSSFMFTFPPTPMELQSSPFQNDIYSSSPLSSTTPIVTTKKWNHHDSKMMLTPKYIGLYLEYVSPMDQTMMLSHTLAQTNSIDLTPTSFSPSNDLLMKEKYHSLLSIHPTLSLLPIDQILLSKMKLDLNLNMNNYLFNNTCFFESKERKTIECTTTIYSFGDVVLESKELQQALLMDQKYIYSFNYVNQFFDAFIKGVLSLSTFNEIKIAIQNLTIVQVFEEINHHQSSNNNDIASPLLAVIYDFELGQGTIDINTL